MLFYSFVGLPVLPLANHLYAICYMGDIRESNCKVVLSKGSKENIER